MKSSPRIYLAIGSIMVLLLGMVGVLPKVALAAPPNTTSYYVNVATSTSTMQQLGYNATNGGEVILDLGGACDTSTGAHGTWLFNAGSCTANTQNMSLVNWFVYGYALNSSHTSPVSILVGTNNSTGWLQNATQAAAQANGAGFASDIQNTVLSYCTGSISNCRARFSFNGASDLEPEWDTFTQTNYWVNGFDSNPYVMGLWDFGDPNAGPNWGNTWTAKNVYDVCWGNPHGYNECFPENYNTNNSNSWNQVNSAGVAAGGTSITYSGVMWTPGISGGFASATAAYDNFVTTTGQSPSYLTTIQNAPNN